MNYQFDWTEKIPKDKKAEILEAIEKIIDLCEVYVPIELYDDDLLAGLLDLRDKLEDEMRKG